MALIGTIRRNFWFVLILLGLALAAFVIMDMTSAGNRNGVTNLSMGEVNGTSIDYGEFQQTEQAYYRGSAADAFAKKKTIWDFYVEKSLVDSEADALGLSVPYDELMDLQFGDNMSPIVTQNWTNQQTGQVDRAQLNSFRTAIENNDEMNPQFRAYWAEQEKQIVKRRKQDKLSTMVSKGMFIPSWQAESIHKADNATVDFEYVRIPFDNISGDVEVSDADIKSYLAKNKSRFTKDSETRLIDYITYDVVASSEDSMAIYKSMDSLKGQFVSTQNDSTFALVNNGGYANFYFGEDQLPAVAREQIKGLNVGEVYGPYMDQGVYSLVKVVGKQVIPDTVKARHILKKCDRNNASQLASAISFIDSLDNLVKRGAQRFDTLAVRHSEDGSASRGGDLGEFVQGTMVQEFNDVCFLTGREGGRYKVVTQFGVHLIEIQDQKYTTRDPKYKIATIVKPIVPSDITQNQAYDQAADIVSEFRDVESLKSAKGSELSFVTSPAVGANDFTLGALGQGQTNREIIKWAFDGSTEVGDISPDVYSFSDPVNYFDNKYVIATLRSIEPAGLQSVEAARSVVETAVANEMKAEAFVKTLSITDLGSLATQHNSTVESVNSASSKTGFINGIGSEPQVIASAMNLDVQSISKPIIGSSGVFVVRPISKQEAGPTANVNLIRQTQKGSIAGQAATKLIQALKEKADMDDQRSKFF